MFPEIQLWYDTCRPFDGQHGSRSLPYICVLALLTILTRSMADSPRACAICEGGNRVCRHLLRCGTRSSENTRHSCPNRSNSCGLKVPSSALQKIKYVQEPVLNFLTKTFYRTQSGSNYNAVEGLGSYGLFTFTDPDFDPIPVVRLESESDSVQCEK